METTVYDRIVNFLGTKFIGLLLIGFGLLVGSVYIDDATRFDTFSSALVNLFMAYVGGNAINTTASIIRDSVAAWRHPDVVKPDPLAEEPPPRPPRS